MDIEYTNIECDINDLRYYLEYARVPKTALDGSQ